MKSIGILSLVSILLFSISAVSAIPPSGNVPVTLTIPSNAVSLYNITFYNNLSSTVNISINIGQAKIQYGFFFSNMNAKPLTFSLSPDKYEPVLFSFVPTGAVSSLPQSINISYTQNGVLKYFIISATIVPIRNLIYSVSAPVSIKPTVPLKFNVSLLNQLGQDVPVPIVYKLNSSRGQVISSVSTTAVLSNLGLDEFSFSLPVNSSLPPGNYTVSASTNYGGDMSFGSTHVIILSYVSSSTSSTSNINWFGGTSSFTVINNGNVNLSNSNFTFGINSFDSLFLTGESSSFGAVQLGSNGLTSSLSALQPGQSLTLSYSISYLPLYVIAAIIIAAIALFLYLNRKLVISKEVVEHKVVGGFVDVKIALKVRNVSKKVINNLNISDFVPPHALKVSTVGPKEGRISKVADGLSVNWRESNLHPNDEVLLMYEIKSKLGIVGSIVLKPAVCTFVVEGKEQSKKSNSLILNIK